MHFVLFIVLSRCRFFKLLYFSCWELVSLTGAKWKAEPLITTHTPHTHSIGVSIVWVIKNSNYTAYLSQSHAIIWHNNPQTAHSADPLFGGSLPLVPLCVVSSCLCSFPISPVQWHSSRSFRSFCISVCVPSRRAPPPPSPSAPIPSLQLDSLSSFRCCSFDLDGNQ